VEDRGEKKTSSVFARQDDVTRHRGVRHRQHRQDHYTLPEREGLPNRSYMGSYVDGGLGGSERSSNTVSHQPHRRRAPEEGRRPDLHNVLAEPAFPNCRQSPGHRETRCVRQACGPEPKRGPEDGAGRPVLSLADQHSQSQSKVFAGLRAHEESIGRRVSGWTSNDHRGASTYGKFVAQWQVQRMQNFTHLEQYMISKSCIILNLRMKSCDYIKILKLLKVLNKDSRF